jgi:hypothetical protein
VSITLEKQLDSNIPRTAHVWTACVQGSSSHVGATTTTYPPQLVAKIYDPVFVDDNKTKGDDPFFWRGGIVSDEVEAYRRLGPVQGTKVPRFYGHFVAALPAQDKRTVYILLLEEVPGRDMRAIVPPDVAGKVCAKHKGALVDAVIRLFYDIFAYGVDQHDMQSRKFILREQRHVSPSVSGTRFCDTTECPLALEVDCDELHMVMVDFRMVGFEDPEATIGMGLPPRATMERMKSIFLERWLENRLD